MGLPFAKETMQQLKDRFNKALEKVWDVDAIAIDPEKIDRPAQHREHVFDFEDGIRLIISKDKTDGNLFIHISGSSLIKKISDKEMLEELIKKLVELNGSAFNVEGMASVTPGGIIHFLLPINKSQNKEPITIPFNPSLN